MSFKIQQVLRIAVPVTAEGGQKIRPGTRVVVVTPDVEGKVRVKVADPKVEELRGVKVVLSAGAFKVTKRGRPKVAKAKPVEA